ncbi:kinase binding protein CGI-121-domain-containing protein [Vararia minispora EC-137]|uniref:Kinase binding protein CGI-121-domain-containing protein n=1 Tax=Vararia minispora EC-137 TaxID=1314806 RepID=A0ACB8QDE3_9AGAM|nr:kinase binding protein CGI-121-domain-containing protein [Vararia minispora EC-137]
METFTYSHFPSASSIVHIAFFTHVSNAKALRARIINAASLTGKQGDDERERVNFAFVDARPVASLLHLQTAICQAILSETQDVLRTKTVHSEILWALNPSHNITEAIRRYGVSDTTTSLLVVRVTSPDLTDVEARMKAVVDGQLEDLSALASTTDWATVKKYYKLAGEDALKEADGDDVRERLVIDSIAVSTVAMKSVMNT